MEFLSTLTNGFELNLVAGWGIAFLMAVGLVFLFAVVTLDMLSGKWEEMMDNREHRAFVRKWK